jgi:hypothetical protein
MASETMKVQNPRLEWPTRCASRDGLRFPVTNSAINKTTTGRAWRPTGPTTQMLRCCRNGRIPEHKKKAFSLKETAFLFNNSLLAPIWRASVYILDGQCIQEWNMGFFHFWSSLFTRLLQFPPHGPFPISSASGVHRPKTCSL